MCECNISDWSICDGRILLASEDLSNGMVPASKSSIQLLKKIQIDERNINNECMICLNELGKKSEVLCLPCLHIFQGERITNWLGKSHYCPLCRFEMPTEQYLNWRTIWRLFTSSSSLYFYVHYFKSWSLLLLIIFDISRKHNDYFSCFIFSISYLLFKI